MAGAPRLRFETLREPGRLPGARAAALREQILALNLKVSVKPAFVASWEARIGGYLASMDTVELVWAGDALVGLLGERSVALPCGIPAVFIDSLAVAPDLQDRGVGRRLAGRSVLRTNLRGRGRAILHVSRTANPHVAAGVWRALRDGRYYYPSYDPARPCPAILVQAARELTHSLWPDKRLRAEVGVLEGAYGGAFVEVAPTHHAEVARHFAAHVDLDRGDAIVQIVRHTPATWLRLATHFGRERARRPRAS